MAAITDPLVAAVIVCFLGAAATGLFQRAGYEAEEMNAKMVFHLLLGPVCLAVLILVLGGLVDHLYLVRWLQI